MTTSHTPGPWYWDGNICDYDPENETPWLVQEPWHFKESQAILTGYIKCKSEANARLIAAAPELLAVLQAIAKTDFLPGAWNPEYERIAVAARAAIAKATS